MSPDHRSALAAAVVLVLVANVTSLEGQPLTRDADQRAKRVGPQDKGVYFVASYRVLSPAGRQTPVSGRVFDLALSPDQQLLAVKASHNVFTLDAKTGNVL